MDPLWMAVDLYRRCKFEACVNVCTQLLENNPYDEAVWSLKVKSYNRI